MRPLACKHKQGTYSEIVEGNKKESIGVRVREKERGRKKDGENEMDSQITEEEGKRNRRKLGSRVKE